MKTIKICLAGAACALALPATAMAQKPAPSPAKVAKQTCQLQRAAIGKADFRDLHGSANKNRTNAMRNCKRALRPAVKAEPDFRGANRRKAARAFKTDQVNAAKTCKAARADEAAFAEEWGTKRNAFGKCVSETAQKQGGEDDPVEGEVTA